MQYLKPLHSADGAFHDKVAHNLMDDHGKPAYGFRGRHAPCCYSVGWALFDRNDPKKLIARSDEPILKPETPYECYGIAPYTVFGNALIKHHDKWIMYYGCSDNRIAAVVADCK